MTKFINSKTELFNVMKNLVLVLFSMLCINSMQAQWKIGPKASAGFVAQGPSTIEVMPMSDHGVYHIDYLGSSPISSIGFMMYNDLGPIFLQTELMATSYRLDFMIADYEKMASGNHVFNEQYYVLEVPVNAGLKIGDFKVGLGPVMEFNLDMDSEMASLDGYVNKIRNLDFSFQALVGYQKGILHIDMKYVNKFSSITDGFALGTDVMKFDGSANRFMFGVGIAF